MTYAYECIWLFDACQLDVGDQATSLGLLYGTNSSYLLELRPKLIELIQSTLMKFSITNELYINKNERPKHANSVHLEPESNSPQYYYFLFLSQDGKK